MLCGVGAKADTPSLVAVPQTESKPQEPTAKLGAVPLKVETNKDKEEKLQL